MIRKYADQTDWGRIVQKQFAVMRKHTIGFSGAVTLMEILKVREPLVKQYGGDRICIADDGYKWLQHFPECAHYTLTSMYDDRDRIVQWYVAICKCHGVNDAGIPWYEDLHLGIVLLPDGRVFVQNRDRLDEALERGELDKGDYELALLTADQVVGEFRAGSFDLLLMANKHLQELYED